MWCARQKTATSFGKLPKCTSVGTRSNLFAFPMQSWARSNTSAPSVAPMPQVPKAPSLAVTRHAAAVAAVAVAEPRAVALAEVVGDEAVALCVADAVVVVVVVAEYLATHLPVDKVRLIIQKALKFYRNASSNFETCIFARPSL